MYPVISTSGSDIPVVSSRLGSNLKSSRRGPVLEVAHRAGDEELLLQALIAASTDLRSFGDVDEALRMLAEGAVLAEAAGNLYWQMMAHMVHGETHLFLG
jgi:hypothetical protein